MLRPSPNHGAQRLPNDDDDDDLTLKLYPWICSNILCRRGGAACIGFAQIVSRGFWSLITIHSLAYR